MARTFLSDKGCEFVHWEIDTYTSTWDSEPQIVSSLNICNGDDVLYFGSNQEQVIKRFTPEAFCCPE